MMGEEKKRENTKWDLGRGGATKAGEEGYVAHGGRWVRSGRQW